MQAQFALGAEAGEGGSGQRAIEALGALAGERQLEPQRDGGNRERGISEPTFYRWKKQYGGLGGVRAAAAAGSSREENRKLR